MEEKKERLLKIQQDIISLENLLFELDMQKRKRDERFKQIIDELGKIVKKNLWKQYEEWRDNIVETKGIIGPDEAMNWLKSVFQQIIKLK